MPRKHGLGWPNGKIIEYEDGTAAYVWAQSSILAFRVPIAEVSGFSVTPSGTKLSRQLNVLGDGRVLASVEVNNGTCKAIERWFRTHPSFGGIGTLAPPVASPSPHPPALVADEIRKLAQLRLEGFLTKGEFVSRKARLLAR